MSGCLVTLRTGEAFALDISTTRVKHMRRSSGVIAGGRVDLSLWRRVLVWLRILPRQLIAIDARDIADVVPLAPEESTGVE